MPMTAYRSVFLLSLALSLLAWGCDGPPPQQQQGDPVEGPTLMPQPAGLARLFDQPEQTCTLELQQEAGENPLTLLLELREQQIVGRWSNGPEQGGSLQGLRRPDRAWQIRLEGLEQDLRLQPRPDGRFEGTLIRNGDSEPLTLVPLRQTWPVSPAVAPSGELTVAFAQAQHGDSAGRCQLTEHYAQLQGLAPTLTQNWDGELRSVSLAQLGDFMTRCAEPQAQARQAPLRHEARFHLSGVFNDLLSYTCVYHRLGEDSLHYQAQLIDLATARPLGPQDYFRREAMSTLAQRVEARLVRAYGTDWGLQMERIPQTWQFEAYPSEMVVFFNAYALGRFQVRRIEVAFTYEELEDLLRKDGPLH